MKALNSIDQQLNSSLVLLLLNIYEHKGKEFYYNELFSRDIKAFSQVVSEENLYFLAKLTNLNISDARLRQLAKKDYVPKNQDETLFNNLKEVLNALHKRPQHFELIVNQIEVIFKVVANNLKKVNFIEKELSQKEGLFDKKIKIKMYDELDQTFQLYNRQLKIKKYELISVINALFIDLYNNQYIDHYNDIVSIIVYYALLLYNFKVFKYVSFFKHLYFQKEAYLVGMNQSTATYQTEFVQMPIFNSVIYETFKLSFNEAEQKLNDYSRDVKQAKSDSIEGTIMRGNEVFSKADLKKAHPNVSETTIDRVLSALSEQNIIRSTGKGRSAKWVRLKEKNYEFDLKDINIFDYE